jgi:hypothetical protein
MRRHLRVERNGALREFARIERYNYRCNRKNGAVIRQSTENTVRTPYRLLCRLVVVAARSASGPVANDELITVSAGLPWSRLAGRQRAQEHVKRKGKGCRGGNP